MENYQRATANMFQSLLKLFYKIQIKECQKMGYNEKSDLPEAIYIAKRKWKEFLYSFAYYACRIFPIDHKKVVIWTFEGDGGYGCSPKYIAEEILK